MVWSAGRGCALTANYHLTPHTLLQVPQRHPVPQQPPLLLHGGEQGQADPGGARPGAEQEAAAQLWPVGWHVFISFMLMIMTQSPCRRCSPAHPQPRPSSSPPLRRSPRPSAAPAPGGGGRVSQDRGRAAPLQSYSDFRQVAEAGAGARWVVFIFAIFIRSVL